jgi:hypothetical protein
LKEPTSVVIYTAEWTRPPKLNLQWSERDIQTDQMLNDLPLGYLLAYSNRKSSERKRKLRVSVLLDCIVEIVLGEAFSTFRLDTLRLVIVVDTDDIETLLRLAESSEPPH